MSNTRKKQDKLADKLRIPLFLILIGSIFNWALRDFISKTCYLDWCSLSSFSIAGFISLLVYTIIERFKV